MQTFPGSAVDRRAWGHFDRATAATGLSILSTRDRRGGVGTHRIAHMLSRWGIRLATSLAGIAVGIVVSATVLDNFSIDAGGLVAATLLFWIIHIAVQFLALRVLIRQPSVALAGLLALGSTIVSLVIVNIIVSGMSIHGVSTYVLATLIIWLATAAGDVLGRRMIRARRQERVD